MKTIKTLSFGVPKCALCGEELTAPIAYNGAFYGWTCIKKVNPAAKKSKDKTFWVEAISFTSETSINDLGNEFTVIKARFQGDNYKESTFTDVKAYFPNQNVIIQGDKAFINLMAYKNGINYAPGKSYIK